MAYAAATSLYHTIHLLLISSRTSIGYSTEKLLKNARWGAQWLQQQLREYDKIKNSSEGVLAVEALIRDEARRLEDLIESEASAQFVSQSQSHGRFSLNLDRLRHDINCFLGRVEMMRAEYMEELYTPQEEEDAAAVSSSAGGDDDEYCNVDMVGYHGYAYFNVRNLIVDGGGGQRIAFTGMVGIGKTALVKKLFHDPLIREEFECGAFVRVGQQYEFEDVLMEILDQLSVDFDNGSDLGGMLRRSLRGRRYLIVFDDTWDNYTFQEQLETIFSGIEDSGCILLTSKIEDGQHTITHMYQRVRHATG